jgi:AraC-like DNA-binding protein
MSSIEKLVDIIRRHVQEDGVHVSRIPGVSLIRSETPTMPIPVVYKPTLCVVAQGRKQVLLGKTVYAYDSASYLVASVDLPVTGTIIEASKAAPYLCLVLDLHMAELHDLVMRDPISEAHDDAPTAGIALGSTSPELLDAALRLARLLDSPDDIEVLAPLVIREILYRLLTGPASHLVRQMAKSDSRLHQISKTIAWLREHYHETCRIDDIANIAGMSRSTFHTHFKTVTSMSPLEFRNQLRLQEARRLMVAESMDAAGAGYRVGYESPSHFSRDYVQMFGLPPAKDAGRLRTDNSLKADA